MVKSFSKIGKLRSVGGKCPCGHLFDKRDELLSHECLCTRKFGHTTLLDQSSDSTHVVGMPMRRNNVIHLCSEIDTYCAQVPLRYRPAIRICRVNARIYNYPPVQTNVHDDALAKAWSEDRDLEFIGLWRYAKAIPVEGHVLLFELARGRPQALHGGKQASCGR
jgi:hypothetical protein